MKYLKYFSSLKNKMILDVKKQCERYERWIMGREARFEIRVYDSKLKRFSTVRIRWSWL